jgi:MFS family permease
VIRLPRLPIEGSTGRTPGLAAVLDGFGYLRGHPVLLMSFVVDIIAMVFGMPRALFPEVAHESFGGPVDGGLAFALLYAGIPVGAVLGGVLSGWVSRVRGQGRAVVGAIAVWGLAMTGFGAAVGLAPQAQQAMLVASVLLLVVGGAADMASAAFRSSMLQNAASDAVRGRLQGVFIVVVAGGPRIADVLHGAAASVVGTAWAAGIGGLLVLVGLAISTVLAPSFVRYRLEDPEPVS